MNRPFPRWLAPLAALLVLLLLGWWGTRDQAPPAPLPGELGTARVTRGDLQAIVRATGRVEAEQQARLSLAVGGRIAEVLVAEGDRVERSAALLRVDPTEVQLRVDEAAAGLAAARAQRAQAMAGGSTAQIEAAQAEARAARLALEVAESALDDLPPDDQGESEEAVRAEQARAALAGAEAALRRVVEGATPEEEAALEAQVTQAEARLAQAQATVDATTLMAPFSGTVTALLTGEGERVNPTQPLLVLADMETMVVAAAVDEVDVGRVAVGQPVTVTLDAFPTRPLPGLVASIAPAASEQRAATSYRTVVAFDPLDLPVRLDLSADLQIRTAAARDTLLLPQSAIRYAETTPFVLVERDGRPVEQPVTLGARDEQLVEILDGLAEGEVVRLP